MSFLLERDAVTDLPSGLCACRLNDENAHIFALSPRSVYLRSLNACPADSVLTLALYRPERGDYEFHTPNDLHIESVQRHNGAVLTRFSFEDPDCAAAIRRMLDAYARYLEIKSTEGAGAYAAYAMGYPADADDIFLPDLQSQRGHWASMLSPLPEMPPQTELAVELNCPELWKLYLNHPLESFMRAYARCRALAPHRLPPRLPKRLYIGNACCRHLFPEEGMLNALIEKAQAEGLALSFVSAELRVHSTDLADRQIVLAQDQHAELVVNDWGMLMRASKRLQAGQIVLGTQLNRRRKDPRLPYKAGFDTQGALLTRNNLNDPGWIALLREMGVKRFEFESCGYAPEPPSGHHSLHLPFCQTNTSLWCPVRALCLHGNRGRQSDAPNCPRYCEQNVLLYPAHLKMLGRWNSLFALDDSIAALANPAAFDRWVLNF